MVTCGNTLQIVQNQVNLEKIYSNACGNTCGNAFKLW